MRALILNNEIIDVVETEFKVHPSLTWIDCPDDCTRQWSLVNNIPTAPAPEVDTLTYAEKRKIEYDQLNQFEMQFDDKRDDTTTWVDKINEIKGRHPK